MARLRWHWGVLTPFLVGGLWLWASSLLPSYMLASPAEVWAEFQRAAAERFWMDLGASLFRLATGFLISSSAAILTGLLAASFRPLRELLSPLITFFQSVPPMAWAPLLMIPFGLGHGVMIAVIFVAAYFPILVAVEAGIRQIPDNYRRAAANLGANRLQMALFVLLPAAMPTILGGLRIGFGLAWRSLVAAEMIGGSFGLGYALAMNGQIGNSAGVLHGIFAIGVIATLLDRLVFARLEAAVADWKVA